MKTLHFVPSASLEKKTVRKSQQVKNDVYC